MMAWKQIAMLVAASAVATAAGANFVAESKLDELMARSDFVVVGTVTDTRESRKDFGSAATLAVAHRLKGESPESIIVRTDSRIAELATHCCEKGASYIMFLARSKTDGGLVSALGQLRHGPRRRTGPTRCRDSMPRSLTQWKEVGQGPPPGLRLGLMDADRPHLSTNVPYSFFFASNVGNLLPASPHRLFDIVENEFGAGDAAARVPAQSIGSPAKAGVQTDSEPDPGRSWAGRNHRNAP